MSMTITSGNPVPVCDGVCDRVVVCVTDCERVPVREADWLLVGDCVGEPDIVGVTVCVADWL